MKQFLIFLWIAGISGGFYIAAEKTYQQEKDTYSILDTPPFSHLKSETIDLLTLGHRGVYDDFINIWVLQILSDKSLHGLDIEKLEEAVLKVTSLQPKIEVIYMVACFAFAIDLKRPEVCEKIIIDGLNAFPQSWRLPMTQGFIYLKLLKNAAKASGFYSLAASRPDSPTYVGELAQKLLDEKEITRAEMDRAMDMMMQVPGGSRVAKFLNDNLKKHHGKKNREDIDDRRLHRSLTS